MCVTAGWRAWGLGGSKVEGGVRPSRSGVGQLCPREQRTEQLPLLSCKAPGPPEAPCVPACSCCSVPRPDRADVHTLDSSGLQRQSVAPGGSYLCGAMDRKEAKR